MLFSKLNIYYLYIYIKIRCKFLSIEDFLILIDILLYSLICHQPAVAFFSTKNLSSRPKSIQPKQALNKFCYECIRGEKKKKLNKILRCEKHKRLVFFRMTVSFENPQYIPFLSSFF